MNKIKKMRMNYLKSIGRGLAAVDVQGNPIKQQTLSIWFSRSQVENLLKLTDEKEGGVRIFFAQYDEDTIPTGLENVKEKLIGKLTVALAPCKVDEVPHVESFINGGTICPPFCMPPPTWEYEIAKNAEEDILEAAKL
ncbi:hypothetical protein A33Q_2542 [Indibacter alkaliphilus LW1]|uniref:Uncharacterized protein n=1 Tax=Indibacter alkaliphilus (strain CCUG 57479 / KCTC 22604 / LW1) TaxID=1189612 RepID=S2DAK8_INDAL|nr:hypothetical protein [Indibacter alkaliphilus]EOZ95949.1 hypothetical protein A33Q_2542 [Indibacter alkaliphilus LW1]